MDYDYTYENGEVVLYECLTDKTRIERTLFRNCNLLGPVVVSLESGNVIEGDVEVRLPREVNVESVVWPLEEEFMIGTIGIRDCRFVQCSWEGIGFAMAGKEEQKRFIEKLTIGRFEKEFD